MKNHSLLNLTSIAIIYFISGIFTIVGLSEITDHHVTIGLSIVAFTLTLLSISYFVLKNFPDKQNLADRLFLFSLIPSIPLGLITTVFYKNMAKALVPQKQVESQEDYGTFSIRRGGSTRTMFIAIIVLEMFYIPFSLSHGIPVSTHYLVVIFAIYLLIKPVFVIKDGMLYDHGVARDTLIDASSIEILELSDENVIYKKKNRKRKYSLKDSGVSKEKLRLLHGFFVDISEMN